MNTHLYVLRTSLQNKAMKTSKNIIYDNIVIKNIYIGRPKMNSI